MSYAEVDLFGVYVSPFSLMLLLAWFMTILFRRAATSLGLLRHVWHPALFMFAIYLILLSSIVLLAGARS